MQILGWTVPFTGKKKKDDSEATSYSWTLENDKYYMTRIPKKEVQIRVIQTNGYTYIVDQVTGGSGSEHCLYDMHILVGHRKPSDPVNPSDYKSILSLYLKKGKLERGEGEEWKPEKGIKERLPDKFPNLKGGYSHLSKTVGIGKTEFLSVFKNSNLPEEIKTYIKKSL